MAEVPGGNRGGVATAAAEVATQLTVSGSFKEGKGSSRRQGSMRLPSMDADEFMNLFYDLDPVKVELNWLENEDGCSGSAIEEKQREKENGWKVEFAVPEREEPGREERMCSFIDGGQNGKIK